MTTDGLFDGEDVWRPILERGFGAVDMEAAGVAEVCEEAGVAWSVYRGISDRPDEHIVDQAVFALSKPDGSADPVALAKYLARDPRRAPRRWRISTGACRRPPRRQLTPPSPTWSAPRRPPLRDVLRARSLVRHVAAGDHVQVDVVLDAMRRIC